MQLDEVREQLQDLAARVPAGNTSVDDVLDHTRRTVKRRGIGRAVALVAVLALLGTLAVVIDAARPSPEPRVDVVAPTTTTPAPHLPFSAGQLRAHDGAGVPKGWGAVDEGDARVWVPESWMLETPDTCVVRGPVPAMVSVGRRAQAHCGTGPPAQSVAVIPHAPSRLGPFEGRVHGYRIYESATTGPPRVGLRIVEVPQLGVEIALRGELSNRILSTLAPSSRVVALAFAYQPAPHDYRTFTESGIRLAIPPHWTAPRPGGYCGLTTPPKVAVVDKEVFSCPPPSPSVATALLDGVLLYESPGEFGPAQSPPIAVLHHDTTTVSVYAVPDGFDELELRVRRAGSSVGHELVLGLGRDGRVAGGVLASIEATT